ncbi:PepSY domain-containing protein [Candidatus Woesearchaeota archaeon]|nr:PepSY domain-containing protein [Candidatus Woesearchaeota archaeon]
MIKEAVNKIELSKEFSEWKQQNNSSFLSNIFIQDEETQLSYYNPENDRMTTFFFRENQIKILQDQEILEPHPQIKPLIIENLKITSEKALEIAKENLKEPISKIFLVIQTLEDKTVYNITFFTQTQKIVNTKIDAEAGTVVSNSSTKLSDFYRVEKN